MKDFISRSQLAGPLTLLGNADAFFLGLLLSCGLGRQDVRALVNLRFSQVSDSMERPIILKSNALKKPFLVLKLCVPSHLSHAHSVK